MQGLLQKARCCYSPHCPVTCGGNDDDSSRGTDRQAKNVCGSCWTRQACMGASYQHMHAACCQHDAQGDSAGILQQLPRAQLSSAQHSSAHLVHHESVNAHGAAQASLGCVLLAHASGATSGAAGKQKRRESRSTGGKPTASVSKAANTLIVAERLVGPGPTAETACQGCSCPGQQQPGAAGPGPAAAS
jgi:hypothetical protein